jgi:hypothetical protein
MKCVFSGNRRVLRLEFIRFSSVLCGVLELMKTTKDTKFTKKKYAKISRTYSLHILIFADDEIRSNRTMMPYFHLHLERKTTMINFSN